MWSKVKRMQSSSTTEGACIWIRCISNHLDVSSSSSLSCQFVTYLWRTTSMFQSSSSFLCQKQLTKIEVIMTATTQWKTKIQKQGTSIAISFDMYNHCECHSVCGSHIIGFVVHVVTAFSIRALCNISRAFSMDLTSQKAPSSSLLPWIYVHLQTLEATLEWKGIAIFSVALSCVHFSYKLPTKHWK